MKAHGDRRELCIDIQALFERVDQAVPEDLGRKWNSSGRDDSERNQRAGRCERSDHKASASRHGQLVSTMCAGQPNPIMAATTHYSDAH